VILPLTPLDFLARARRLFADRIGVIDGDHRFTYADFGERCDALARLLVDECAIRPGDVVAWRCGNTHELLEAYFGVLLAGAVLLPVNIRLAPAEIDFVLRDADARVVFRHPDQPEIDAAVATRVLDETHHELIEHHRRSEVWPRPEIDERSPAEIFYTSGSTGSPKGAVLSHRALYLHAIHNALTGSITGHDVILHTIPLFHVNGWGVPHYLTGLGGQHVMLAKFDPAEVLRLVEQHRVTRLLLVPTMVQMLLDHPDLAIRDVSSVVQVTIGGAPPPPAMLTQVEQAFGAECVCGYGMTETSPSMLRSLDKPGHAPSPERRATTGLPIIGVDLRVFDADGTEVPWDAESVGEVCVRSNHVMSEYLGDPAATAQVIVDGWLHTGDLAHVRPDGFVQVVDRKKDLIVSGGENIACPEVEHALLEHPAVREASVIGVSDDRWGEVPRAFVSLVDTDDEPPTVDELIEFVRARLAHFKAPRDVIVLDDLPKGGTGKIQKQTLRAWTL